MNFRWGIVAVALIASSGVSFAQSDDACRPDVRRLCSKIKQGSDDDVYLSCLKSHRAKLSSGCRRVLERNGQ